MLVRTCSEGPTIGPLSLAWPADDAGIAADARQIGDHHSPATQRLPAAASSLASPSRSKRHCLKRACRDRPVGVIVTSAPQHVEAGNCATPFLMTPSYGTVGNRPPCHREQTMFPAFRSMHCTVEWPGEQENWSMQPVEHAITLRSVKAHDLQPCTRSTTCMFDEAAGA
jgi:hypothetical protein